MLSISSKSQSFAPSPLSLAPSLLEQSNVNKICSPSETAWPNKPWFRSAPLPTWSLGTLTFHSLMKNGRVHYNARTHLSSHGSLHMWKRTHCQWWKQACQVSKLLPPIQSSWQVSTSFLPHSILHKEHGNTRWQLWPACPVRQVLLLSSWVETWPTWVWMFLRWVWANILVYNDPTKRLTNSTSTTDLDDGTTSPVNVEKILKRSKTH